MPPDWLSIDDVSQLLGRDAREIERLAARGRIPAHKRGGDWQFHSAELTPWIEQEMRTFNDAELSAIERGQASPELSVETPLTSLLTVETIAVPLEGKTRRSVLEGLIEAAGRTWHVYEPANVLKAVLEREDLMSTAFDNGVALPHPRQPPTPESLGESVVAFGRALSPINFGAANNRPTDLFFLVLCRDSRTHLHVLARLGRMIQRPGFLDALRSCDDAASAFAAILAAEQQASA